MSNRDRILALIKRKPGISATTTVIIDNLPGYKTTWARSNTEALSAIYDLQNEKLIEEVKGRLYPL